MLVGDFTAFIKLGTADLLRLFKPSTMLPVSNSPFLQPLGRTTLLCIYLETSAVQEKPSVNAREIKEEKKKREKSWTLLASRELIILVKPRY